MSSSSVKVDSEVYEFEDLRLARGSLSGIRGFPLTKTSSPVPESDIGMVVSFEKRGAGGSGRRGLPPYSEEGVPGLGLPLISAGSYSGAFGGGLVQSTEPLEGVLGRTGEDVRLRGGIEYGGIEGALPRLDGGLFADMSTDGT